MQKLLYRQFFFPFVLLDLGYATMLSQQEAFIFLPNGDFIDMNNAATYKFKSNGAPNENAEEQMR